MRNEGLIFRKLERFNQKGWQKLIVGIKSYAEQNNFLDLKKKKNK